MADTITYSEAMKEIRRIARKNGMTFKRQNAKINGSQGYKFISRDSGTTLMSNCTLWSAYDNCMSGHIETLNK